MTGEYPYLYHAGDFPDAGYDSARSSGMTICVRELHRRGGVAHEGVEARAAAARHRDGNGAAVALSRSRTNCWDVTPREGGRTRLAGEAPAVSIWLCAGSEDGGERLFRFVGIDLEDAVAELRNRAAVRSTRIRGTFVTASLLPHLRTEPLREAAHPLHHHLLRRGRDRAEPEPPAQPLHPRDSCAGRGVDPCCCASCCGASTRAFELVVGTPIPAATLRVDTDDAVVARLRVATLGLGAAGGVTGSALSGEQVVSDRSACRRSRHTARRHRRRQRRS